MSSERIKVSIVIPVYNMEKYLVDCLESVVHQTLQDIEIIIVNDGSTDKSAEIIKSYVDKYPDMVKAYEKENGGQATARNMGIGLCKGEYIGFVDADDKINLQMYETMYRLAVKDQSDLVECNYSFLMVQDGQDKELKPYGHVRRYQSNQDMFINPLVSPWNKLYKAEILQKTDINFPEGYIYEDTSFFIKAIPFIKKWSYVDEKYVLHYMRANSTMTANKSRKVGNIFPVLEDMWQFYEKKNLVEQYKQELEFFTAKILLCSSLERVAQVQQKDIQKDLQNKTIEFLQKRIPSYRKNPYLKKGALALYMKSVNRVTIGGICLLLQIKAKRRQGA